MKESSTFSKQKKSFFVLHFCKVFFRSRVTQLLVLLAVMFVVYFDTISTIVKAWLTLEHSHGVLIFAVSGYLIWRKRNLLKRLPVHPDVAKGFPVTVLGCLIFVVGKFSSVLLLQEISLIVTMLGLVYLTLGSSHMRILLLPMSYLVLMFPIFDEIFGNLSIHFQTIAALIASSLLKITGMPVLRHAQFIEMPHATLEVAKLCNGISHITALLSLAIPISDLILSTKKSKVLFILAAFILGVFANGLRVALIGVWMLYFKESSIHGPFSMLYSSSVFLFEACALIFIAVIMGKRNIGKSFVQESSKEINGINLTPSRLHSKGILIGVIVFLVTGGYLYLYTPAPVPLKRDLKEIPLVLGSWRGQDVDQFEEDFGGGSPDLELKRVYYDQAGNRLHLYIGYYGSQRQDREVVSYRHDWLHNNAQVVRVSSNPYGFLEVNKTRYSRHKKTRFAYFWYDIDGKVMTDRYGAKLKTLINAFLKRRTNGALVVVSYEENHSRGTDDSQNVQITFVEAMLPVLRTYFADNQNVNKNFCEDKNTLKTLVSPSGMVETPRLQAKREKAKCEQSEHEPDTETNATSLSYPRKRVSRGSFFQILFWIPASAGMTKKRE